MKHPNGELVAKAWIQGLPGIPANAVATTLPEDRDTWLTGFVQITADPGGRGALHFKKRESNIGIVCWYQSKPGSDKPPWNKAVQLAEYVYDGGFLDTLTVVQRTLDLPAAYDLARVLAVEATEPERLGSDEAGNAAYGIDMQMTWIAVPR